MHSSSSSSEGTTLTGGAAGFVVSVLIGVIKSLVDAQQQ